MEKDQNQNLNSGSKDNSITMNEVNIARRERLRKLALEASESIPKNNFISNYLGTYE